jgi:hypothetical protein
MKIVIGIILVVVVGMEVSGRERNKERECERSGHEVYCLNEAEWELIKNR